MVSNLYRQYWQTLKLSIAAGIAIGLGGTVRTLCPNPIVGAFLFCIGLLIICNYRLCLYTGAVGFLPDHARMGMLKEGILKLLLIWIGNWFGAMVMGVIFRTCYPNILPVNDYSFNLLTVALQAMCCGALMYVAVDWFQKEDERSRFPFMGVLFCISVFILSGYKHSVAEMFYTIAGRAEGWLPVGYILWVSLFNGIGAVGMNLLTQRKE